MTFADDVAALEAVRRETKETDVTIINSDTGERLTLDGYGDLEALTNHEVATFWLTVKDAIKALYTSADAAEGVLLQRMHETGATALPDADLDIKADAGSPEYLLDAVQAGLAEDYPDIWEGVVIPETTKVVPAKIDGRKARSARNMFGDEVEAIFAKAEKPPRVKLKVARKKSGVAA